ncbi:MAG: acetate--CoA ligase family protein [Desulfomonilia bacterium]|jgi:acetyltransferase
MAGNPIENLMNPASIAIAGASNNFTTMGTIQCLNLITNGFPGEVLPIHPKEKVVLGKKAYQTIADLPYAPDVAVLVVPTRLVPDMVEDFGKLGTRHMIIVSAGFKETGEEGGALEKVLIEKAKHYGIRFLGPNCLGIVNTHLPLNITVGPIQDYNGKLGLASQSGTYIAQVVSYLHKNGIVMSKAISVGNEADIDIIDCIEYLGQDETTRAIGLYIEGIKDASRFLEVATRVSRIKPIVAQYVGGTEAGARSGSSHTGALSGPDHLYTALFEQAGVIGVESIEEVYKVGWALASQPRIKGRRIAVLTNSGGPGTGIANTCDRLGLEVREFSPILQEKVSQFLPSQASAHNPVDLTFHVDMKALTEEIPRLLFESDEVDGIIIHGIVDTAFMELLYPAVSRFVNVSKEKVIGMRKLSMDELVAMPERYGKPLLISSFFGREDNCIQTFHTKGIPTFDAPEKAARAMSAFYTYLLFRNRPIERPPVNDTAPDEALRLMQQSVETGIDEFLAKGILRAYGVPTAKEALAYNLDEVKANAEKNGYPVVLKVCSSKITHKTEFGMVRLNLKNEHELIEAYHTLRAKDHDSMLLVAEMLKGDREFIAGISRHAGFPPCVLFGLGGVFAEAIDDISLRLAPLTRSDAFEMLDGISANKALGAYRGMKPVDKEAVADILIALGHVAAQFPQIKEIDLNPIIIVDGKPFVADALMVI